MVSSHGLAIKQHTRDKRYQKEMHTHESKKILTMLLQKAKKNENTKRKTKSKGVPEGYSNACLSITR